MAKLPNMRSISKILIAAALTLSQLPALPALAQPTVSVSAEAIEDNRYVLFTFVQDDLASMVGCHYNLFAADSKSKLKTLPGQGYSIATFFKGENVVKIIAGPLRHLKRNAPTRIPHLLMKMRTYFRVLLSCPEATNGYGKLFSVAVKTYRRGTIVRINQLTYDMKYHMKYYEPG